ncbi:PEP-utilizing enzyme [Pseudarthrobacter sp. CCNWLW247]|uniref:PEP-utilizing enzyme n=1 Tax=Pseudarthrobacter sp. CCNWLW247 TaxID=3127461 RepID=UPI0030787944
MLVCPYTKPSWTPLFQRPASVVVDAGGIAFHAAIVARESGIPAVMGTGSGTTALQDDQLVLEERRPRTGHHSAAISVTAAPYR